MLFNIDFEKAVAGAFQCQIASTVINGFFTGRILTGAF